VRGLPRGSIFGCSCYCLLVLSGRHVVIRRLARLLLQCRILCTNCRSSWTHSCRF
jgi:hypothetical protein